MPDAITKKLIDERQSVVIRAEGLKQTAAEQNRDLTEDERKTLGEFSGRISRIDEQLILTTRTYAMDEETAEAIRRYSPTSALAALAGSETGHKYRNEGEAVWDVLHQRDDDAARARLGRINVAQRAAQHMGTSAAATTATAGGWGALIVNPIVGPIIQLYPQSTPFLNLLGARDVSGGKFLRPRLIDPDLLTAAGPHAAGLEKGELPSRKWDYDTDPVTMQTIGNYINLSYEALEWAPSALQDVINHLKLRTSLGIEARAVLEAAKTLNEVDLAATADAGTTQAAVWSAMAKVFQATGQPATWIVAGPLGVAMLGSKVDLAGRPIFPMQGAANANGSANAFQLVSPFGLTLAQTPAITDTTLYVGNAAGLEAYVHFFPVLQADEPSVLGRQIGAAAAVGFYSPITSGTARDAVVKLAPGA